MQTGLISNRALIVGLVETTKFGEILIDGHCRTGVKGVYAAGGITTVPFIAMDEGVKAGLCVFEDYARGNLEASSNQEEQQGG